jgi:hypothetical protein
VSLLGYSWLIPCLGQLHSAEPALIEGRMPVVGWPFETHGWESVSLDLVDWQRFDPRPHFPDANLPPFEAEGLTPKQRRHLHAALPYAVGITAIFAVTAAAFAVAGACWSRLFRNIGLAIAAVAQAIVMFAPTMPSTDLYSYVLYGRIAGIHGGNPYAELPSAFATDPFLPYVYWHSVPSFYGPLWSLLSAFLTSVTGAQHDLTVLAFRGLAAVSVVAATALVTVANERLSRANAVRGIVLLGWNPLMVIEFGISAHNDAAMVACVAAALLLATMSRAALASGAVTVGGMLKFVAFAMGPMIVLLIARRAPHWRRRGTTLATAAAVTSLVAATVAPSEWTLQALDGTSALGADPDRYTNSLAELALPALRLHLGERPDDVQVPLNFAGRWVGTHMATSLLEARDVSATAIQPIPQWSPLVVIGPERESFLRVYDPNTGRIGFTEARALGPIPFPPEFAGDAVVLARAKGPIGSPYTLEANRRIRQATTWVAAGAFVSALLFGTGSVTGLAWWWTFAMLAVFYAGSTWFWPWYVSWALVTAAVVPGSLVAVGAFALSWSSMLLYALLGFSDTSLWYVQTARAVPVFALPLVITLLVAAARAGWWLAVRIVRLWRRPTAVSVPSVGQG